MVLPGTALIACNNHLTRAGFRPHGALGKIPVWGPLPQTTHSTIFSFLIHAPYTIFVLPLYVQLFEALTP